MRSVLEIEMAKRKEPPRKPPRERYTVEEVYGSISSSSDDKESRDSSDQAELDKENLLEGLSEEEGLLAVNKELSTTPSGISNSSNVARRLSLANPSSEVGTGDHEQPLREYTNAGGGRARTNADTPMLILEEIQRANSRLNRFVDSLQTLEKTLSSIENTQSLQLTPSSSSSSTPSTDDSIKKRQKVPSKVSVRCYSFHCCVCTCN